MKTLLIICCCCWSWTGFGQLTWLAEEPPQLVFSGMAQQVGASVRNPGTNTVRMALFRRLYQLSSATAMPAGEVQPWKTLEVLAGQTVREQAEVTLPEVKTVTQFALHWLGADGRLLGRTEFTACPRGVLRELNLIARGGQLGVWDPENRIMPLLDEWKVEYSPLGSSAGLQRFEGRLAIVGPVFRAADVPPGSLEMMQQRARSGLAVVWLHPAPQRPGTLISSHAMEVGEGMVVAAPATSVSRLADSPGSQLNLLALVEMALHRKDWHLVTRQP